MLYNYVTPSPVSEDVSKCQYSYLRDSLLISFLVAYSPKSPLQPTMQMKDDSSMCFSMFLSHSSSFPGASASDTSQQMYTTSALLQQLGCREKYFSWLMVSQYSILRGTFMWQVFTNLKSTPVKVLSEINLSSLMRLKREVLPELSSPTNTNLSFLVLLVGMLIFIRYRNGREGWNLRDVRFR